MNITRCIVHRNVGFGPPNLKIEKLNGERYYKPNGTKHISKWTFVLLWSFPCAVKVGYLTFDTCFVYFNISRFENLSPENNPIKCIPFIAQTPAFVIL